MYSRKGLTALLLIGIVALVVWRLPLERDQVEGSSQPSTDHGTEPAKELAQDASVRDDTRPAPPPAIATGLFGSNGPVTLDDIPLSRLRDQLNRLPPAARQAALHQLERLRVPVNDVASLEVDPNGRLFYRCEPPAKNINDAQAAAEWREAMNDSPDFPAAVPISQPPAFHSRPGAKAVLYLDFNGHIITGTAWNTTVSSYTARPFNTDTDATTFSTAEQVAIRMIFQRVAEDFRPFDIDITTEEPSAFGLTTARVLITTATDANNVAMPHANAGGVAYLDVFGDPEFPYYSPALVYANNLSWDAANIAEAASHEMGHNLSLSHDGTATETYYQGHGQFSETSWAPIMGTSYYSNVSHWSKGEYYRANNPEDDIAIIAGHVGYSPDDHSSSVSIPTNLLLTERHLSGAGIIGFGSDQDLFAFTLSRDQVVSLELAPFRAASWQSSGGNLHGKVLLTNSSGAEVPMRTAGTTLMPQFSASLAAGTYFVRVSATGTGDPWSAAPSGYTAYGSAGQFRLVGNLSDPLMPVVTNQSVTANTTVGAKIGISVTVAALPDPAIRWQRLASGTSSWIDLAENEVYSGTTTTSLQITATTLAMSGDQFRCIAANSAGTAVGAPIPLTVLPVAAPVIYGLPPSIEVATGASLSLPASVTGTWPITFQWYKDAEPVPSAVSDYLYRWSVTTLDSGSYTLKATNAAGTVTSAPVAVTVKAPVAPVIAGMNPSLLVPYGATLHLSPIITGSEPMTYQWKKDGQPITNGAGSYYYKYDILPEDAGTYTVTATNAAGSAASAPVVVTVAAALAPTIVGLPPTLNLTAGTDLNLYPSVTGSPPITFQWSKDGQDISGATQSGFWKSTVSTSDAGEYVLTATNAAGTTSSSSVLLSVQAATAPTVYGLPPTLSLQHGSTLSLYPIVSGSGPMTYQWKRNQEVLSGGQYLNYYKSGVTADHSGDYTLTITNSAGSITSAAVRVTVETPVAPIIYGLPPSINLTYGQHLNLGAVVTGTTPLTLQWSRDGKAISGATYSSYSRNYATESDSGEYQLTATNAAATTTSTKVSVRVSAAALPVLYGLPPQVVVPSGSTIDLVPQVQGTQPMTYTWKKDGVAVSASATFRRTAAATADSGVYTVSATNVAGTTTSAAVVVTVEAPVAPTIYGLVPALSVDAGTQLYLNAMLQGTQPMQFQWKKDGAIIKGANNSYYSVDSATAGDAGSYTLVATNVAGTSTSSAVAVQVNVPVKPTIYGLLPTMSADLGQSITFSPTVNGTQPMTFQWKKNGVDIAGATSRSHWISPVVSTDSASYTLKATNSAGTTTSSPVVLSVNAPVAPIIHTLSPALTVKAGETMRLSVTVSGTAPFTFQWHKDGEAIPAATSSSYSKANASAADNGSYTVTVANAAGTAVSSAVAVTVAAPVAPFIVGLPTAITVNSNQSLWLSPTITGTAPITYQWKKDGVNLESGTSSQFSKWNLSALDSGAYTLTATNATGTYTSPPVHVTVNQITAPSITGQPVSQTVPSGTSVVLAVTAIGYPAPTFTWLKDGGSLSETSTVIGVRTATLRLLNCQPEDAGDYEVLVENDAGSITSAQATLTVRTTPSNQAPTASFVLSNERTIGAAITITLNVNDPDGNYQYANLRVHTPKRGWLTLAADGRQVVGDALDPALSIAATPGLHTRTFQFTRNDGVGEYRFALTAVDTDGETASAPVKTIYVEDSGNRSPHDFDGDGVPDLILQNVIDGRRALRTNLMGTPLEIALPTVAVDWEIVAVGDFNADLMTDLVWQNTTTGARSIWFMSGTTYEGNATELPSAPPDWRIAAAADFNGDGQLDFVQQNISSGERNILLRDASSWTTAPLATVSIDWMIVGAGDMNGDSKPDLVWRHMVSGATATWLMDGVVFASGHDYPTVPVEWDVAELADFNGDGQRDILWQHRGTRELSIWILENNAYNGRAIALPATDKGFVAGTSYRRPNAFLPVHVDFDGDGLADVPIQNFTTGARSLLLLSGVNLKGVIPLPIVGTAWRICATADMNGDTKPDVVWQNDHTGESSIWLMNGTSYEGNAVSLPTVPASWRIAAVADMNGDKRPDLIWQNVTTGQRSIWFMHGPSYTGSGADLAAVPPEWIIVGAGDLSGDSKPDLLFRNTHTGELSAWVMNGPEFSYAVSIATVSTDWHVAQLAEFTGDGKLDILWQHRTSGALSIWAMNYLYYTSLAYSLPTLDASEYAGPAPR